LANDPGVVPRYLGHVKEVDRIRELLDGFEPEVVDERGLSHASVALVLRSSASGPELLFIERATRSGDPWSGHMAFPGGRLEPHDPSPRHAAERETHEEVGVSLHGAEYLGLLGELQGNPRFRQHRLVVSAHVYHVEDPEPFLIDEREVREAMWFGVSDLLAPHRHVEYVSNQVSEFKFPGILVGDPDRHVVWGLTYRFLDIFMHAIECPLPDRWAGIEGFKRTDDVD
jgi:8-oxo-dGTP pyrophosphatase MutT (NUDIX family)